MARILVILLSLATLITAFQNCGTGGTLTLEQAAIAASSNGKKLLGSCSALPAGALCDERWSLNLSDGAAFEASCGGVGAFQSFGCPRTADLLGVCETVVSSQTRRMYFYSGYSQGMIPPADEAASARQNCAGTWQ